MIGSGREPRGGRRASVCSVTVLALLLVAGGVAAQMPPKRFALLVGVNECQSHDVPTLRFANADVHALETLIAATSEADPPSEAPR